MGFSRNQMWLQRIEKLDAILSLVTALIEIGILLFYMKDVVTIEIAILFGLIVALVFFIQDSWRNRKALESHEHLHRLSKKFPAVEAYLNTYQQLPTEYKADTQGLYSEIIHTCDIQRSNATIARRAIGRNISEEAMERMFYMVCGETSVIDNGRLQSKVLRNLEGNETEELDADFLWTSSTVKVLGIDLNPEVMPKVGKIDVTFVLKWPGAFVSAYGYIFVSLLQYTRGVENLATNISFEEEVSKCSVWTYDLKNHRLKELQKLQKPQRKNNKYTIRWERAKPDINKIYIFRYKRSNM